jgi:hypothetical protein
MDKILEMLDTLWESPFVKALAYLVIALISAFIISFIVKKIFRFTGLEKKLDSWGINEGERGTAQKFIGKLVFLIVFLLFLPSVLGALGLESVSEPITDFANAFISYIPRIIAAAILVFIGIFVGRILSRLVELLLSKTKIDTLPERFSKKSAEDGDGERTLPKISTSLGQATNAIIILIAVVEALVVLNIEALSQPAMTVINKIFDAIPDVIFAAIVISVGAVIANIAASLIGNLLSGLNVDALSAKMFPKSKMRFSLSTVISNTVRIAIILFVIAEGVKILELEILTAITSAVIAYIPLVIKALVILIAAMFGISLVDNLTPDNMPRAKWIPKIAKAVIWVIAAFMILSQLDFATVIVNWGFIIVISALAVAFAISFGIGGRDFAKTTLEKLDTKKNDNKNDK